LTGVNPRAAAGLIAAIPVRCSIKMGRFRIRLVIERSRLLAGNFNRGMLPFSVALILQIPF
jgi:hypothetical protein